jgi:hypothetical protein
VKSSVSLYMDEDEECGLWCRLVKREEERGEGEREREREREI